MLDQVCHPLRCVPVIFWELCWLMLALCWLMLALCWLMLALCFLMLGSCWVMLASSWVKLAHVGSSWPKLASRCVYVGSSWPQDAQDGLPRPPKGQRCSIFYRNLLILEHPGFSKYFENIGFIGPFAIGTFLFLSMLFGSLSWWLQVGSR